MTEQDELLQFGTETGQAALAAAAALPSSLELHRAINQLRRLFEPDLVAAALRMTELRRRGRAKFSCADAMLFTAEGLEQSSSEIVASYRSQRFAAHGPFTDLCCGIGGDTLSLAATGRGRSVDRNPAHVLCCKHNLSVYGRSAACEVIGGDALEVPIDSGTVFIDPSRRAGGRRVRSGEEYSPPLSAVLELAARVDGLGAKLSPALHLDEEEASATGSSFKNRVPLEPTFSVDQATGSSASELEIISLDGVCREMVLWTGCFATCTRKAAVLRRRSPGSFEFVAAFLQTDAAQPETISLPILGRLPLAGEYLLEPDPAVIRAHLVSDLAERLGAWFMDEQIAYLISATDPTTPFANVYQVLDAFPYSQKRLKEWLVQRGVGNLTVKKRGFPLSPEQVRASLRLKGSTPGTVVLTRAGGQHLAVLVEGPLGRQEP